MSLLKPFACFLSAAAAWGCAVESPIDGTHDVEYGVLLFDGDTPVAAEFGISTVFVGNGFNREKLVDLGDGFCGVTAAKAGDALTVTAEPCHFTGSFTDLRHGVVEDRQLDIRRLSGTLHLDDDGELVVLLKGFANSHDGRFAATFAFFEGLAEFGTIQQGTTPEG
jgi:hypothetical protein